MAGTAAAVDYFAWIGESMAKSYHSKNEHFVGRRKYVHAAFDFLFDYEKKLARHLIDGLQGLPRVRVQGVSDPAAMARRVPTVSFTVDGIAPSRVAENLARENIFVWSGHNYAVEAAKSLQIYDKGGAIRVGPVHYNTVAEIDTLLTVLADILAQADAA
jgi:selenocysteine lyase/cysteine desulfurase